MKITIAIAILLVLGGIIFYVRSSRTHARAVLIDGRVSYNVDVANAVVSRAKGLSGRASLAADQGMLFLFPDQAIRYFWMQGMLMPLDVLWIRDNKIIGLQANIPHPGANNGQVATFQSPEAADSVLEINAGDIAKNGLAVGQSVEIKP